jgi:exonuclease SbcD
MKILHTADWHIGQLFHGYDRFYEHEQFLNWLVDTLFEEKIDVLLISGDVFDLSNPSAASVKLFYSFLNKATRINPKLQIVVTAGNHDSAARLESPKPLLESSDIHIVGLVEKAEDGSLLYDALTIPLKDRNGEIATWCIAAPFLRQGDYPSVSQSDNQYAKGVTQFYAEAFAYAQTKVKRGEAIIAMGHLHAQQAEMSDLDKMERQIMGGVESVSADAFDTEIAYVALGHIHKAQRIGGAAHIRYSGSPLPMSFSERNYRHQVTVFELIEGKAENITMLEIPLAVPVQSVPAKHEPIEIVLAALARLPATTGNLQLAPYLEVRVLENGPDPARRHKIEQAIEGKQVRLATINVKSVVGVALDNNGAQLTQTLDEITPVELFASVYKTEYGSDVPDVMLGLFNQVAHEVTQM